MSDATNAPEHNDAPRSPFAGCLILIVMAVVVLILAASAAYSVVKQTEAYKTFTETEPKPAPIADLEGQETELNSLIARLRHFDHEMSNDRPAQIELDRDDLNLAIAHFEVFQSFRGQLYFKTITANHLLGTLHYPFRSTGDLPKFIREPLKIEVRENNLNGTFIGTPLLTDGKLIITMESITPTKGEIPDEFFQQISRFLISGQLEQELKDDPKKEPELLTKLKKLTSLSLEEGKLTLGFSPDATPPSAQIEANAMATKAKQLVALGAIIFILTMILFFVVLSRRQKARRNQSQELK